MTSFYHKIQETALRSLDEYGRKYKYIQNVTTSVQTNTGKKVTTSTEYNIIAVKSSYSVKEVDGERILMSDIRLVVAAPLQFIPRIGDIVVIEGKSYKLLNYTPTQPSDVIINYQFQLRG